MSKTYTFKYQYHRARDDLEKSKQFTCEACCAEFDAEELFDQHQEPYKYEVCGNDCAREREKEDYIQCKDCEYSTDNFYYFGRHTYENHKVGGKDYKENVVDMSSVSVKTELRPEECKHSKKLNEEQVKEELVEKKRDY